MSATMSQWARELADEVKAAAPNAPEPRVWSHGLTMPCLSGLSWDANGESAATGAEDHGRESYWVSGDDYWVFSPRLERLSWRRLEREALGLSPRAYFIRLVKEMWP